MNPFENDPELETATQVKLEELKVYAEAKRRLDAEREHAEDLDDLYLDRDGLERLPAPAPLIPGVLPRHAYGVLRGRDQSFKSFVALDWALTLATGRWWQLQPVERVRVLYVAGEGAWGLRARVAAWETRSQLRVDPAWFTVRQAALNMHRPGPAFDHLLKHVDAGGYGLVVVDTLRRVSGAADGNGSEMGLVIDSLDRIKQATDAGSVLVVAHTDKGDTDSRGYSGIEDDADFVWHARRDGMRLDLELTKMKDGPDGRTLHLQAWPVALTDTDPSLVLEPAAARPAESEATESEAKLVSTLREAFPDGTASTPLKSAAGLPDSTYYRVLSALVRRGLVIKSDSHGRPFYTAAPFAVPAVLSSSDSPADLQVSHDSHTTTPIVPPLPRPLGSGSMGVVAPGGPCTCGVPRAQWAGLPHRADCNREAITRAESGAA